jgi:Protein of unknown function (DUF1214)
MRRLKWAVLALAGAATLANAQQAAVKAPAPPASASSQPSLPLPEWKDHMARLGAIQDDVAGQIYNSTDPQQRQDAWNWMFAQLARIYIVHMGADADHPEFLPLYNSTLNVAAPNPDYVYYGTALDGTGSYRLRGFRGTNRFTYLQFSATDFTNRVGNTAAVVLNGFALNNIKVDKDGMFDLLLSAERPAGYTGEWIKLDPRARSVFMRAASYDWVHERDPVVGIDRTDKPVGKPRATAQEIATRLASLPDFVRNDSQNWWRHMADLQKRNLWNTVGIEPWGTFPGQVYIEGMYRLAEDEALVLETDVPKTCRYWAFLVGDMQFRTVDWTNHQSSLNGFQAKLDADGKFRAVIARRDPGVPNWLDTGGYAEGVIQGRWNVCDSSPVPKARLVKLADLRNVLPKETATMTPQQRDVVLRERRLGSQMRRKW